jgi:hypothetical protein
MHERQSFSSHFGAKPALSRRLGAESELDQRLQHQMPNLQAAPAGLSPSTLKSRRAAPLGLFFGGRRGLSRRASPS